MTYRDEFPDLAGDTMPQFPAGFVDESWHNDTKPHWLHAERKLEIWVAPEDRSAREYDAEPRFQVYSVDDEGQFQPDHPIFESEIWDNVEAFLTNEDRL